METRAQVLVDKGSQPRAQVGVELVAVEVSATKRLASGLLKKFVLNLPPRSEIASERALSMEVGGSRIRAMPRRILTGASAPTASKDKEKVEEVP